MHNIRGPICLHTPVKDGVDNLIANNPHSHRIEVEIARTFLGIRGRPARYIIVTVPPRKR